jgi:hypothetical protein
VSRNPARLALVGFNLHFNTREKATLMGLFKR